MSFPQLLTLNRLCIKQDKNRETNKKIPFMLTRDPIRNHQTYQLHSISSRKNNLSANVAPWWWPHAPPGKHKEPEQSIALGLSRGALCQHVRQFYCPKRQVIVWKWNVSKQETRWISYTLQNWLVNFLNNYICFIILDFLMPHISNCSSNY